MHFYTQPQSHSQGEEGFQRQLRPPDQTALGTPHPHCKQTASGSSFCPSPAADPVQGSSTPQTRSVSVKLRTEGVSLIPLPSRGPCALQTVGLLTPATLKLPNSKGGASRMSSEYRARPSSSDIHVPASPSCKHLAFEVCSDGAVQVTQTKAQERAPGWLSR